MNELEQILQTACETTPVWQYEPAFTPTAEGFSGIQAVTYDGLTTKEGKTTTFAYLGIPESDTPVPAIVLVHGAGGDAYLPWVKMWMDRGYAAIAMSDRGHFPTCVNAGAKVPDDKSYCHGMYGDFVKDGYVDSPEEDGMKNADLPLEDRWIPHALVKVIHAHNLLRSLPQVDNSKIGISGISWGGVITSMVITHDTRFAFAVPVYGSGYLKLAPTCMGPRFQAAGNAAYLAEDGFNKVRIPVLWLAWNDDNNFIVTSNSESYLATVKNNPKTRLSLVHNMGHDHPKGWGQAVIDRFADWVINDGTPLVGFATQPEGRNATAILDIPKDVTDIQATLYWIDAPMTYSVHDKYHYEVPGLTFMDPVWQVSPASISGNVLSAELPENARGYYLEIRYDRGGREIILTSVYVAI